MFGRLSIVKAIPGRRDQVVALYKELDNLLHSHEGYVTSYVFTNPEDPNEVGRLALWDTHSHLDRASQAEKVVAIRGRIHLAIQPAHIEQIVEIVSQVSK